MSRYSKTGRRRLYPLPVEAIFDHPEYVALPSAGRGMLWSLCEHFWKSKCAPLPRDDDQLFAIARAHRPTWRAWRTVILRIFNDCAPDLVSYHKLRDAKGTSLSIGSQKARSNKRLAQLLESVPADPGPALSIPAQQQARPATPAKAPRRVMVDRRR